MNRSTLVYFVCSPHSRTGVTTTARLLTDYHLSRQAPVEGFDSDAREPRYALSFPELTHVVDVAHVKGQIALFDRLLAADEKPKVVDVWHRSFEKLFSTIAEIGFVEEARRVGVTPVIVYQMDASNTAAKAAHALQHAWPDLLMTLIHNEGAAPLGEDAHAVLEAYPTRGRFVIPALDRSIARALEDPTMSLSRFLVDPPQDMSIVVRAAIKAWLTPIFTQFQSFELRLNLQSSEFLR